MLPRHVPKAELNRVVRDATKHFQRGKAPRATANPHAAAAERLGGDRRERAGSSEEG